MTNLYQVSDDGLAVVCRAQQDVIGTYAVRPEQFPTPPWRVAESMNAAYDKGYRSAQHDMQRALGL